MAKELEPRPAALGTEVVLSGVLIGVKPLPDSVTELDDRWRVEEVALAL